MPQRTNEFQDLVTIVERAFNGPNAEITPSAMATNALGFKKEIDVLVTFKQGPRKIQMAVEARDHARNQQVAWIHQMHGEYTQLPDIKIVVAVSSSPFSEQAIAAAKSYGIELRTFAELKDTDWTKVKGSIRPDEYFETGVRTKFLWSHKFVDKDMKRDPKDTDRVVSPSTGLDSSYKEFQRSVIDEFHDQLKNNPAFQDPRFFLAPFTMQKPLADTYHVNRRGGRKQLVGMMILVERMWRVIEPMKVTRKAYGDTAITVAEADNEFYKRTYVEFEDADGQTRIHAEPEQRKGDGGLIEKRQKTEKKGKEDKTDETVTTEKAEKNRAKRERKKRK